MNKKAYGFTLVELLIVIVIIGILAAISVATYSGIISKANDTAVKSDISNMAKKIELDRAERGSYIPGGSQSVADSTKFPEFSFKPTKNAYDTSSTNRNFYYCAGTIDGVETFRIEAKSKSGKVFSYEALSGLTDRGVLPSSDCRYGMTNSSYSYGYEPASNRWWSWTD